MGMPRPDLQRNGISAVVRSAISAVTGMMTPATVIDIDTPVVTFAGPPGSRDVRRRRYSKYIPAGPNRNCGWRGISPKSVKRAALALARGEPATDRGSERCPAST